MSAYNSPLYLDHNASTPVLPEVLNAMLPWLQDRFGNPSSTHAYGRAMRRALYGAREQVALLIDCSPEEIYFTSGGTESNNLAIRGVAMARPDHRTILTSVIEHPATLEPCSFLEHRGYSIFRAPVDDSGRVEAQSISEALSDRVALVTIMQANSETGSLQPIHDIAGMAHQYGVPMHTDAAQSVGKVAVSVKADQVDLLSIAGHKLYAPKGVGALYVRSGTVIEPVLRGAGHEKGLRPGTENVAFITGLGEACAIARDSLAEEGLRVSRLRDHLWTRLAKAVPGLGLNGHATERLPNTLNVRFPGVSGSDLLEACPGIAASTGSACHEAGETASAVILAMGIPEDEAIGSVRLTLGRSTGMEDIDDAADQLIRAWQGQRLS